MISRADKMVERFIVGHDTPNAAVLREARSILRDIDATSIGMVGATAFGSRTKGYAMASSDLDMTAFIDMDGHSFKAVGKCLDDWGSFWTSDTSTASGIKEVAKTTIDHAFWRSETMPIVHCAVAPASPAYLQACAKRYAESGTVQIAYAQMREGALAKDDPIEKLTDWSTVGTDPQSIVALFLPLAEALSTPEDERSKYRDVTTVKMMLDEDTSELGRLRSRVYYDERVFMPATPTRLFNASLHNPKALRGYRANFLEPLLDMGADGDQGWRVFVEGLRRFEDGPKHPRNTADIYYPATPLAAARAYTPQLLKSAA